MKTQEEISWSRQEDVKMKIQFEFTIYCPLQNRLQHIMAAGSAVQLTIRDCNYAVNIPSATYSYKVCCRTGDAQRISVNTETRFLLQTSY